MKQNIPQFIDTKNNTCDNHRQGGPADYMCNVECGLSPNFACGPQWGIIYLMRRRYRTTYLHDGGVTEVLLGHPFDCRGHRGAEHCRYTNLEHNVRYMHVVNSHLSFKGRALTITCFCT